jgi:uncharacterized protein (DUF1330 family)
MAAYIILDIKVFNKDLYAQYISKAPAIIKKHGGRYLVRGGTIITASGNWNPERIVVIEFVSMEHLKNCFDSPEYREIAPLREQSTISKAIMVEGYSPA